jgi:signal transduction histidine kinase
MAAVRELMQPDENEQPLDFDQDSDLYAALDAIVRDNLKPVSIGLGALLVILAAGYALLLPRAAVPVMVALAAGSAAVMFGIRFALARWPVPISWAQPIGAATAGIILLNSLVYLYLVPDPKLTTTLMLPIIGAGLFFLSALWLTLVIGATLAGWVIIVWLSPSSPDWLYFGAALFVATALAAIIHAVRFRTVLELVTLRLSEKTHRVELDAALASTEEAQRLAETMYDVGCALTGTLDLAQVLNLVLERLAELVPYDRGSVMLLSGNEMEIVAARGFPEQAQPRQIRISLLGDDNDIFRHIHLTQRPLAIADVSQRPDWQYVEGLPPARSWLGVPLVRSDVVIGMLSLARETPLPYDDDEVTLATAFGGQAAIALENARLYDRITKAYDQLERLDRTKSDFIGVASHELRTPLTSLRGSSQILLNDPTIKENPFHLELVSTVYSGAVRLHEIVDSMLDVLKIDSRALQLYPKPLSVPMLIRTVCNGFARPLADRHLTLTVEEMHDLPEVEADLDALRKVLYNLVVNAIKYTPDGGSITISGRSVPGGEKDLAEGIEVVVRDSGIGIDPQFHELIFTKFYQTGELALHSTSKTQFKGGGPGLGLAIARGIVEAHGGKLWVESPGSDEETCPGSQFHVFLPLRQRRNQARPASDRPAPL